MQNLFQLNYIYTRTAIFILNQMSTLSYQQYQYQHINKNANQNTVKKSTT